MTPGHAEPDSPPPHKRMQRIERPNTVRYLTFSCYKRLPLLDNPKIRDRFAAALVEARSRFGFHLLAWVTMPEHVHLLIMPEPPEPSIVKPLWWLKRETATHIVARWRALGAPILHQITDASGRARYWQRGGGYDRVLWNEGAIRKSVRCIHDNPVRRGLAETPEVWAWSSARALRGDPEALVPIDRVV